MGGIGKNRPRPHVAIRLAAGHLPASVGLAFRRRNDRPADRARMGARGLCPGAADCMAFAVGITLSVYSWRRGVTALALGAAGDGMCGPASCSHLDESPPENSARSHRLLAQKLRTCAGGSPTIMFFNEIDEGLWFYSHGLNLAGSRAASRDSTPRSIWPIVISPTAVTPKRSQSSKPEDWPTRGRRCRLARSRRFESHPGLCSSAGISLISSPTISAAPADPSPRDGDDATSWSC